MTLEEVKTSRLAGIKADLAKYGINGATEIVYNPTYEQLYAEETISGLDGFEKGEMLTEQLVESGFLVRLGVFHLYEHRVPKSPFVAKIAIKIFVWLFVANIILSRESSSSGSIILTRTFLFSESMFILLFEK